MTQNTDVVHFYLPDWLVQQIQKGELTFYSKLISVIEAARMRVVFHDDDLATRLAGKGRTGYSVCLMHDPVNARSVTLRKSYFYPFWTIQTSAKRWEWPVAKAQFDPASVTRKEAAIFVNYWRKSRYGATTPETRNDGFVYVPLQGKLLAHRSFQSCSPLDMLRQILRYDKGRKIIATLHPGESYSRAEQSALDDLCAKEPRLSLGNDDKASYLSTCDYVVTQNSSAALFGYFFHKPTVLFAKIDFHHIAANAQTMGAKDAIEAAPKMSPDYDAYLCWFFKYMSINAELPDAEDKIARALRRAGWPV